MTTLPENMNNFSHIDITLLKQLLGDQKKINRVWVKELIQRFIKIVKNQPNVLHINQPVIIIGDIHGQFYDLLKIISLFPSLETQPKQYILFLGDYVDRGPLGVQVTLLLMALKVKYPNKVIMLRGNHQTRQMTQIMNFYDQACQKYDQDVYFDFMDGFDALPLVCIVNQSYFCVHGGITKQGQSIQQLMKLNRFDQIPLKGSLCDLVWSDPVQDDIGNVPGDQQCIPNYQRNCSIFFGCTHTRNFLKKTKMITIIRAHQVQIQGYKQHIWPKWKGVPMVYTIFSAPNYCGSYGNLGAILTIQNSNFKIRQFKQTDPKYYLPTKYNAFNFSLPKIYDCLDQIMKRMTKKVIAAKFPEFVNLNYQQAIAIYANSAHCKSKQLRQNIFETHKGKERQFTEEDAFRKSIGYFSESQKRPSSLIYNDKKT